MQAKSPTNIRGIDVSHHQGNIDWMQIRAAGIQFVYIKSTEGVTYQDPKFKEHYTGAKRAGLKIGFYHYARPYNDPRKEVANLLETTKDFPHDLPFALDIETNEDKFNRDHTTNFCLLWLQEIEKLTGETPIIYTYTHFARNYLGPELIHWPVWIAHYGTDRPGDNGIWGSWAIFQYTSDGSLPGYNGRLDMNVMEASFLRWKAPKELPTIQREVDVFVDDEFVGDGFIINDTAYLPARMVVQNLDAKIEYRDRNIYVEGK